MGDKNNGDETFLSEIAAKVQKWKDLIDTKDREISAKDDVIARLQNQLSATQIEQEDMQHFMGVADVMRAEARERIEAHYEVFAKWMRTRPKVEPVLVIREGNPAEELIALVSEDPDIGVVVLGLNSDRSGANPVLTRLLRDPASLACPITLVPGDLAKERLEAIT